MSGRYRRLTSRAVLGRGEQPAAVLGPAEQRGEARARVEPGQAEPVDRAARRPARRSAGRRSARSPRSSRIEVLSGQTQSCQRNFRQAQCLFFAPHAAQSQCSHQIQRRCCISSTIMQAIANRSSPGVTAHRIAPLPRRAMGRPAHSWTLEAQPERGAGGARPRGRTPARTSSATVGLERARVRVADVGERIAALLDELEDRPRSAPPPPRRPARS